MRRIAHLSDLHFGTEASRVLSELWKSLAAFAPHLVVVTGDLTQRARSSQFRRARRFLDELPFARLVVPGNHDIAPLYQPVQRILAPYARYRRFITEELDSLWHDDEVLVLGLSSVQPWRWKEGTLSARQLEWIVASAARHPSQIRILAAHHPVVQAATSRPTRRLRRHDHLLTALDDADVGMCLSGHLHRSFSGPVPRFHALTALEEGDGPAELVGDAGSVLAVHASTASSSRLRGQANAYNQITIDGQAVQIDAAAWDGRSFTCLTTELYERHRRVWRRPATP